MEHTPSLDQTALLGPLMAGQILNAFYLNLILKRLSSIDATPEVEAEALRDVLSKWGKLRTLLEQLPKESVGTPQVSSDR